MSINTVCVCGAGTMGSGIAQSAAQAGLTSILYDLDASTLEKARLAIEKNLDQLYNKQKITTAERSAIFHRIRFTNDIQHCTADICIEAIVENIDIKVDLFNKLAVINNNETIFASNTSSLSIKRIAERVAIPNRIIGMHFFNPATIMKLIEIVRTNLTDEYTVNAVTALAEKMGKTAVICKDSPGFIVNRVARPFYIEALRLVEKENLMPEQIDAIMEARGFKMGPFKLMDLIGNDVNFAVSCSVYEQLNKPERLKPSPIQEEKVKQGKLGKKSGEGYYFYGKGL
jgi:3-hydroxybutyryl-CoA dehydrogenase